MLMECHVSIVCQHSPGCPPSASWAPYSCYLVTKWWQRNKYASSLRIPKLPKSARFMWWRIPHNLLWMTVAMTAQQIQSNILNYFIGLLLTQEATNNYDIVIGLVNSTWVEFHWMPKYAAKWLYGSPRSNLPAQQPKLLTYYLLIA